MKSPSYLLADGHHVAALDLSEDALKNAHPEPHECLVLVPGDVSEAADCQRAVAQTVDMFGQLNALIHFAGIHSTEKWEELTAEAFTRVLHVNVTGSFLMAQAVAEPMVEQGAGAIVLTASAIFNLGGVGGSSGQGGPA